MNLDELNKALETLVQKCADGIKSLRELEEQNKIVIEEEKEIAILEDRKKYCKNYLELKQINKKLNLLKFKKRKKGRSNE